MRLIKFATNQGGVEYSFQLYVLQFGLKFYAVTVLHSYDTVGIFWLRNRDFDLY